MSGLETWLMELQRRLRLRARTDGAHARTRLFQFRFESGEAFHLHQEGERFEFLAGTHPAPDITLYLDHPQTLEELLTGRLGGMDAFMSGRYRADGNIVLSQELLYTFEVAE